MGLLAFNKKLQEALQAWPPPQAMQATGADPRAPSPLGDEKMQSRSFLSPESQGSLYIIAHVNGACHRVSVRGGLPAGELPQKGLSVGLSSGKKKQWL